MKPKDIENNVERVYDNILGKIQAEINSFGNSFSSRSEKTGGTKNNETEIFRGDICSSELSPMSDTCLYTDNHNNGKTEKKKRPYSANIVSKSKLPGLTKNTSPGVAFLCSSLRSNPATKDCSPGPAAYTPFKTSLLSTHGAVFSAAPRNIDKGKLKDNFPGPGSYNVKYPNDTVNKKTPFFVFRHAQKDKNASPGPGSYMLPSTLSGHGASLKIGSGTREKMTAKVKSSTNSNPGPGQYDVRDCSIVPNVPSATILGRKTGRQIRGDDGPGPGQYNISEPSGIAVTINTSSGLCKAKADTNPPGPGAYDVASAYKQILPNTPCALLLGDADKGNSEQFCSKEDSRCLIGPGSYNVDSQNCYGFSADFGTSLRFPPHKINSSTIAAVGPGSYDVQCADTVAVSIPSAPRFSIYSNKKDSPGPGSYDIMSETEKKSASFTIPCGSSRFPQAANAEGPGPGQYTVNTEVFASHPAVFIETQKRFVSTSDGSTRISERASCPGPGQYDVNDSLKKKTRCALLNVGGRTSLPTETAAASLPGPGSYSTCVARDSPAFTINKSAPHDSLSKEPRACGSVVGGPGPGSYVLPPLFPSGPSAAIPRAQQRELRGGAPDLGPAPGQYDSVSGLDLTRFPRPPAATFGTSKRGIESQLTDFTPGPGSYYCETEGKLHGPAVSINIGSSARRGEGADNASRARLEYTPGPGEYSAEIDACKPRAPAATFGTCSAHASTNALESSHKAMLPGPGQYCTDVLLQRNRGGGGFSFSKQAKSLSNSCLDCKTDTPGPGAYFTDSKPSGPFISIYGHTTTTTRASKWITKVSPGPGDYYTSFEEVGDPRNGFTFSQARRFTPTDAEPTPGPGSYLLSPSRPRGCFIGGDARSREGERLWREASATPGPGQYEIARSGSKRGPSFTFTTRAGCGVVEGMAARSISNGPGPGAYHPGTAIYPHQPQALISGRRSPNREKEQCNGNRPGPGQYNVLATPGQPKGFSFSKLTHKSLEGPTATSAGPGAYPVRDSVTRGKSAPHWSLSARPAQKTTVRESTPGPGQYPVRPQWGTGGFKI